MPTPDGREWLKPRAIVQLQIDTIVDQHPEFTRPEIEKLRKALEDGFRRTGYQQEFKIARLVEKVKEACEQGTFGPIYIPNTVDQAGQRIPTPVGVVTLLLIDIYTEGFLDGIDEEGNPLEPTP